MNLLIPEDEREDDDEALDARQVKLELFPPALSAHQPAISDAGAEAAMEQSDDGGAASAGRTPPPPGPGAGGSRILALDVLDELRGSEDADGAAGDDDNGSWMGGGTDGHQRDASGRSADEEKERPQPATKSGRKAKQASAKAKAADTVATTAARATRRRKDAVEEKAAPVTAERKAGKRRRTAAK